MNVSNNDRCCGTYDWRDISLMQNHKISNLSQPTKRSLFSTFFILFFSLGLEKEEIKTFYSIIALYFIVVCEIADAFDSTALNPACRYTYVAARWQDLHNTRLHVCEPLDDVRVCSHRRALKGNAFQWNTRASFPSIQPATALSQFPASDAHAS